jgi:predicted RNA-binding Zn ribbon-like protein
VAAPSHQKRYDLLFAAAFCIQFNVKRKARRERCSHRLHVPFVERINLSEAIGGVIYTPYMVTVPKVALGNEMTEQRPPALFIADATALDFLNSIAIPVDTQVEWISSGKELLDWLAAAGLVPADVGKSFLKSAVPGELDAVAAQARALREWFRKFVRDHKGKPLSRDAMKELAPLNRILARDEEFVQVGLREPSASGRESNALTLKKERRWRSADALLIPIAHSMAEFVCTDDFTDVKSCEGHNCTLMFVDRTHARGRRWCSMAVCGNRAKAQAHRDRAKEAGKPKRRRA